MFGMLFRIGQLSTQAAVGVAAGVGAVGAATGYYFGRTKDPKQKIAHLEKGLKEVTTLYNELRQAVGGMQSVASQLPQQTTVVTAPAPVSQPPQPAAAPESSPQKS